MLNRNFLVGCGVGGSGHRFWRLKVNAGGGGSFLFISELEFREIAGVPQPMTGGTPLASDDAQGAAANAFDGDDINTAWGTNATPLSSQWIQYAFADPKDIKQVYVVSSGFTTFNVTNADIQSSANGADWETVKASAALTYAGSPGAATINL